MPGISERLFGSLREAGVSVVMISQGSSEHSICFAVPEDQAGRARIAVERAFAAERQQDLLQELEVSGGCTILAAVGDGMSGTPGVAARLFGSLVRAGVNVKAIAQGSSERNISVVIDGADATRALRAAHAGFYLSQQTLSIGVIGHGHVGGTLLDQMAGRLDWLRDEFGVDLRVRAIAGSRTMVLDEHRIDLDDWRRRLGDGGADTLSTDLDMLASYVHTESVPHAAIIDCTASAEIASRYGDWLASGIHVITPNKKANSGDLEYYRSLQQNARRADAHYFYETTVGAALPVIQTLRDLVQTGDVVRRIEGVFSGTLSYLFNSFDGSVPFSDIVRAARDKGYTEPDPREDLSGMDVARKVVILAREMGMEASLDGMEIEGLIPPGLEEGSVEDFLTQSGRTRRRDAPGGGAGPGPGPGAPVRRGHRPGVGNPRGPALLRHRPPVRPDPAHRQHRDLPDRPLLGEPPGGPGPGCRPGGHRRRCLRRPAPSRQLSRRHPLTSITGDGPGHRSTGTPTSDPYSVQDPS